MLPVVGPLDPRVDGCDDEGWDDDARDMVLVQVISVEETRQGGGDLLNR